MINPLTLLRGAFSKDPGSIDRAQGEIRAAFLVFVCLGTVWIFVLSVASWRNGGSFLTTLGSLGMFSLFGLACGSLLGALMAQPRAGSADGHTHVDRVSEWMTKVLIGVGLTEIRSIASALGDLSGYFGHVFSGRPSDGPIAIVTTLAFMMAGFLLLYFESKTSAHPIFAERPAATAPPLAAETVAHLMVAADPGAAPSVKSQAEPKVGRDHHAAMAAAIELVTGALIGAAVSRGTSSVTAPFHAHHHAPDPDDDGPIGIAP